MRYWIPRPDRQNDVALFWVAADERISQRRSGTSLKEGLIINKIQADFAIIVTAQLVGNEEDPAEYMMCLERRSVHLAG